MAQKKRGYNLKDIRYGEHLWNLWQGEGYYQDIESDLVYFTIGHVDMENEIVLRALASTLQRDGIVDSLGQGFGYTVGRTVFAGWGGILPGETEYSSCDVDGFTDYGDQVEEIMEITWIEF
jgi:hypothetical protein